MKSKGYLRSTQLARRIGVSTDTLRHYERKGVLARAGRSPNGYREYPESAVARVHLIRRALSLGFGLDELAEVLAVKDDGGAPCARVRAIAEEKLRTVTTRIQELEELRDELVDVLQDWDGRLGKTPPGERSFLLESISETEKKS